MESEICDHYELLQVSRRADPIIIGKAFRLLAAFYHPDNKQNGDQEAFRKVLEAYRTLSDPVRRAAYDRETFGSPETQRAAPLGAELDAEPVDERHLRHLILDALYQVRRSRPYKPELPVMAIAELFGRTMEELQFSFWYLRGKKWIEMPDGSDVVITVAGVDEVEASGAKAEHAAAAERPTALPERGTRSESRGTVHALRRPSPWRSEERVSAMLPA